MGGGSRKREEAVDYDHEPAFHETSAEQRRGDEGSSEQDADGSSKVGADGDQATPSAGSRNPEDRPVRPGKDVKQPRAENDNTLEIQTPDTLILDSPRRQEDNADERSQEGLAGEWQEDAEDDLVAEEVEEDPGVESEERPTAGAVAKAVRRLSFSSGSGNELKKIKTNSGRSKEQKKVLKKPVSKTKKAGLVLSVSRVHNRLKKDRYATRVMVNAAVYLAATLEYLVAEVLELAGNCARYFKKKRVTPRHIQLTLLHDLELKELTKGVIVPEGGVKENNIHKELLPKHSANAYASEEDRRLDSEL